MYTVYSMDGCASCVAAAQLLARKGLDYEVVKIEDDPEAWNRLKALGLRSMPQIFNEGVLVEGGFTGLTKKLA